MKENSLKYWVLAIVVFILATAVYAYGIVLAAVWLLHANLGPLEALIALLLGGALAVVTTRRVVRRSRQAP